MSKTRRCSYMPAPIEPHRCSDPATHMIATHTGDVALYACVRHTAAWMRFYAGMYTSTRLISPRPQQAKGKP